nr:MAG TPA: hypothetical protein [Caudoviricetes sp.]
MDERGRIVGIIVLFGTPDNRKERIGFVGSDVVPRNKCRGLIEKI